MDGAKPAIWRKSIATNPGRIFYNAAPESGKQTRNVNCSAPPANSYCHANSYAAPFAASGLGMYPCTPDEPNCVYAGGICVSGACFNAAYAALNGNRRVGVYNNPGHAGRSLLNGNVGLQLAWNIAKWSGGRLRDPADEP